ncbi:MAG: bifunctional proline dehydrogenase/L-glutamate gamma-semialdehyde dehydrogenase PutA, partial [Burkholderiales bacterium]
MTDIAALAAASAEIGQAHRRDEPSIIGDLMNRWPFDTSALARVDAQARHFAERVRGGGGAPAFSGALSAERFLRHFGLATPEGIVLMCLAEALLRIPDEATADKLIRDKLSGTHWSSREDAGLLMNAATWGLMLTGKLAEWHDLRADDAGSVVARMVARLGEPVARNAIRQAMRIMAEQFIVAETIEEAIERAAASEAQGYRFSYDMLGESARTTADAIRYCDAYAHAIRVVGRGARVQTANGQRDWAARGGISVKLSALHPRYEPAQRNRVFADLLPRLSELARLARAEGISMTIDAEEADRLTLSLELFERLARDPALADWPGLGLAVQGYQRRAHSVCLWLGLLAQDTRRTFLVRLVKGAYWDSEIKWAQTLGLADYPVFTRKPATDLSYLVCANELLATRGRIYPQFATHNCHTVAAIVELAGARRDLEFQKLQGMGDALHEAVLAETPHRTRVYAPVGSHRDLLAYLVRRLLENGANNSFVHRIGDPSVSLAALVADPLASLPRPYRPGASTPLPRDLYAERANSRGVDLASDAERDRLAKRVTADRAASTATRGPAEPGNAAHRLSAVAATDAATLDRMIAAAVRAQPAWAAQPVQTRAATLDRAAAAMEREMDALISLAVREAGKTYADAVAEVREAVDFCRYYAVEARRHFGAPTPLTGATGERNELSLHGRGVFAAISPWNFPLAIFIGQVSAALVAGNAVIAKPAEQTPAIAQQAVALLHEAGVPADVLALAVGTGESVGARLTSDERIAGVVFTGSVSTAHAINRALAARSGPIVPLVAETGGLNAMIVDSSALPEQVVADVLTSAFQSAGQRCSALRILAVQADCADRVIELLAGAMQELVLGDPADPRVDVGPVIDAEALADLEAHVTRMHSSGRLIAQVPLPAVLPRGHYLA